MWPLLWWPSAPFWFNPGRGSHFVREQPAEPPEMIGQPARHRRSTCPAPMFRLGEFLMNDTEIVRAANQVHAGVQGVQAGSRVPTLAREARQSLSESPV